MSGPIVDLDTDEPDDVDACSLCKGTGYYAPAYSILRPRGEQAVTCPSCGGSGEYVDHGPRWAS